MKNNIGTGQAEPGRRSQGAGDDVTVMTSRQQALTHLGLHHSHTRQLQIYSTSGYERLGIRLHLIACLVCNNWQITADNGRYILVGAALAGPVVHVLKT